MPLKRNLDKYFAEHKPQAGHGRESLRSGIAFVAVRGMNMVVQLGSTILLARMLSPHDYGLVVMVLALMVFAPMLIDLGTTDAIVQRKSITHADASALFWVKIAIGGALALLLAGGSGYVASFYGEPAVAGIAMVLSLALIVTAMSSQHFALMRRAMQFRRIALIEISSNVVGSIIAIALAFTGWGYWALVAKAMLTPGLSALGAWVSCPWLPGRPQSTPDLKEMIRFGMGVTGFTITDHLARSADRIALGYFYGASPLGYFQNASLLYDNILSTSTQLHDVAVSSLSKLRDAVDELKRMWVTALSSLTFFTALVFSGLAVTGSDIVVLLLGQRWEPAGPLFCIFAVRGIAHVVERTLGWLHVSAGRPDRWMRWGFFSAIFQLSAVFAGLPFGLVGVATAHAIATFCLFLPALIYAGRPLGIGAKDVLRAVGPQMASALVAVAIGLTVQEVFLSDLSRLARFFVAGLVCAATYLAVIVGVFGVTAPLRLAFSLLRDFSPARLRRSS
jgi:PST family polysaccharide transporter